MPARVVALCLALVLFCCGLAAPEANARARLPAPGDEAVLVVPAGDEYPAQAQGETLGDLQALLTRQPAVAGPAVVARAAWPWAADAVAAPVLDGLRRPPRAALVSV